MEKSRAIELLKLAVPIKALTQQEYADFVEAVNMGMDALEQPTSPDTIDRKAALDALRRCQTYLYDARDPELKIELSSAEAAINNLSTIQPEKAQLSKEGTTSDLISKTETVEHLRRVLDATVPITDYDEGYVDGVEFGISTVSTMPTIQPEPQWIPVSERLPDTNRDVLLQFSTSMGVGFWEHNSWGGVNTGDNIYSEIGEGEAQPIAWMPLPEHYKPNNK